MSATCSRRSSGYWEPRGRPSRTKSSREEQRKAILDSPEAKPYDPEQVGRFLQLVHYLSFDSTNEAEYGKLKERIEQLQQQNGLDDRIIYYLATPPVMYESVPSACKNRA